MHGREAVEFERIEGGIAGFMLALVAGDDLRLGLDVEAAQLVAQTHVGLLHLAHRAAERTQLLLQAGAVDRDLAGVVDQLRSEEHTSEPQSTMRSPYAVVRLKKQTNY